jgi:hypothetical protein
MAVKWDFDAAVTAQGSVYVGRVLLLMLRISISKTSGEWRVGFFTFGMPSPYMAMVAAVSTPPFT